jgi:hypothetical protein
MAARSRRSIVATKDHMECCDQMNAPHRHHHGWIFAPRRCVGATVR